jgi:multisubunit Na+/H+ antiporter MnhE subunit
LQWRVRFSETALLCGRQPWRFRWACAAITTLANCVSLTPGTTSLHVSEDLSTLYVHVLDAPDPDAVVTSIKDTFETRIKEIEG